MPHIRFANKYVKDFLHDGDNVICVDLTTNSINAMDVSVKDTPKVIAFYMNTEPTIKTISLLTEKPRTKAVNAVKINGAGLAFFFHKRGITLKQAGIDAGMTPNNANNIRRYWLSNEMPHDYFKNLAKVYPAIYYYRVKGK